MSVDLGQLLHGILMRLLHGILIKAAIAVIAWNLKVHVATAWNLLHGILKQPLHGILKQPLHRILKQLYIAWNFKAVIYCMEF